MDTSKFKAIAPLALVIVIGNICGAVTVPTLGALFFDEDISFIAKDTSNYMRGFLFSALFSIPLLCKLVAAPLLGLISDRIGRKKALLISVTSSLVTALISLSAILLNSLYMLFLSRFISGLLNGSESICQASIADITPKEKKAIYMRFIILAETIGFVTGLILGGIISNDDFYVHFGYHIPFIIAFCLQTVSIVIISIFYKNTLDIYSSEIANKIHKTMHKFYYVFGLVQFRNLIIIHFFMHLAWTLYYESVLVRLMKDHDYSSTQTAIFCSFHGICEAIVLLIIVKIAVTRFKSKDNITSAFIFIALSGIINIIANTEFMIYLSVLPLVVGINLGYTVVLASLSNAVDEYNQGFAIGIVGSVTALSWGIAMINSFLFSIHNMLPFIIIILLSIIGFRFHHIVSDLEDNIPSRSSFSK